MPMVSIISCYEYLWVDIGRVELVDQLLTCSYQEESSLEYVQAREIYPQRETISDDKSLQIPFPPLVGENVTYLGRTSDGTITLSNFRLLVCYADSFINIPLGLIEMIECRDIFFLHVYCKDARVIRCTFSTNELCMEWYKRLSYALDPPRKIDDVFAFRFYAYCQDHRCISDTEDYACLLQGDDYAYSFGQEVERMGFDLKGAWRISYWNEDYKVCNTYPQYHIVPSSVDEKHLENVVSFRSSKRIPSVVWRDRRTGAIIGRCSQPEVGWLGWRRTEDEDLLQAIAKACAENRGDEDNNQLKSASNGSIANGHAGGNRTAQLQKLLIIDARSYTAAVANRAKGGGCECPEYYPNCEIQFMSLANIHTIRKSFQAMRTLCASGPEQANSWLSALENTKWLHHISGLMKSALTVVNAVNLEARPVVVHCSDGWDRTPQIVALAEIMLDPFYRTIEGFQILVEREWLEFGHKFSDRCGQGLGSDDVNERCPVFIQWLDCIHQLVEQFPCAFEFNEAFLCKLVYHTYSCLFGTFLCNTVMEREKENVKSRSFSFWSLLKHKPWKITNYLYSRNNTQVLRPAYHVRDMLLWNAVYLANTAPMTDILDMSAPPLTPDSTTDDRKEQNLLPKTRSCDDIVAALEHTSNLTRTSSDPNLSSDHRDPKFLLQTEVERLEINANEESAKFEKHLSEITLKPDASDHQMNGESETASEGDSTIQIPEEFSPNDSDTEQDLSQQNVLENGFLNDDEHSISNGNILENGTLETGVRKENGIVPNGQCDIASDKCVDCDSVYTVESDVGQAIESSTDTLTEDAIINIKDTKSDSIARTIIKENTVLSPRQNGCCSEPNINELIERKCLGTSISTSTTDISDSHVNINLNEKFHFNGQSLKVNDLTLTLGPVVDNGTRSSRSSQSDGSREVSSKGSSRTDSANSTPNNSHTPCSSCPATPSADSKISEPRFYRNNAAITRQLDIDGLTVNDDPVQIRLHQMECEYVHRIETLERQLRAAKVALYQYASGCNGRLATENNDDMSSLPESTGSGELQSLGNGSTAASDLSWEHIDEKDARMTLWVPDHAVTHCAGCQGEFWVVRRKHHCRNCGKVFCGQCTDYFTSIPTQQLWEPVRVCRSCFRNLSGNNNTAETMVESSQEALMMPC
ncbi:phosphatidylinositol-3,5-bisphosphate 3-phosphatase MTMR3-like [Tubulanus polymorphus]|uniref:phosphatidylinositol-3,5-bisphosphate 3-phosphatase MTMR3-like n=1 Tax=Tubulanus polymorphus TaxID=672921 RepID=UPI003DA21A10